MTQKQLLLELFGEESKKPDPDPDPSADTAVAATPPASKPRARRTSKLSDSLKGLPTVVREIIHPAVLASP